MPTRRTVLKLAAVPFLTPGGPYVRAAAPRVAVIGAGAFGGWTALWLARRGAQVTLVDAWGPGNMRASSGGETRVIRSAYADRAIYTRMATRALDLWKDSEREWGRRLFVQTGALWLFGRDDSYARASVAAMSAEGVPWERPSIDDARRRWPQVSFDGISTVLVEPSAGYLYARQACAEVVERAKTLGADYRVASVRPFDPARPARSLPLEGGGTLEADIFVFACGPWLGRLFPDAIGPRVRPTRQSVFYFGAAPGDTRFDEDRMPVWGDFGDRLIYGIPGNGNRGFKLADDTLGPDFDPTTGERHITDAEVEGARTFLRSRFPGLADAPFLGGEVCQSENSPDSHFIVDRHPAAGNVWIVGGGSGHGFKMGPALGEMVAGLVLSDGTPDAQLRLARLK